jgi:glycosyltransferase involved in cell wall biosynthesis
MRVLILNYEYPPLGGGAGVATAQLATHLAERRAAVDVVTAGANTTPASLLGVESHGGLSLYRVRSQRTGIHQAGMADAASYLRAALPVVRRLLDTHRYDVLHIFFSLPTGALLPLLDLRRVPVVVSLRGSDVPGYDPHNRTLQRVHRVVRPFTRWIWRRADRVVALSESLGQLARQTMPELAYSVIHNGVDVQRFRPPVAARQARVDRIRCLAVARLVERKGITDLLRALAQLERGRFELEIVGSGPDASALRELTAQLGLAAEVRFTGALNREEVAERYRAADLFTLASWEESFGNVFAEALASGLPIVGSRVGGIPEFVEHGRHGLLVPPRDPAALAAAIRRLADAPDERTEMAIRNREKAETRLSWGHVTDRYLEVYQAIAHRSMTPSRPAQPSQPAQPAKLPTSIW